MLIEIIITNDTHVEERIELYIYKFLNIKDVKKRSLMGLRKNLWWAVRDSNPGHPD